MRSFNVPGKRNPTEIQTHKRFKRMLFLRTKTQFCPNKQLSFKPFTCLDLVLEHWQSFLFQVVVVVVGVYIFVFVLFLVVVVVVVGVYIFVFVLFLVVVVVVLFGCCCCLLCLVCYF